MPRSNLTSNFSALSHSSVSQRVAILIGSSQTETLAENGRNAVYGPDTIPGPTSMSQTSFTDLPCLCRRH